jgi:5-methylcytosine-specific restriction protein B
MALADQIREFALDKYVRPARNRKARYVDIRVGDVHASMGLSNRLPAVCAALGTEKFEDMCAVQRVSIIGPLNGAKVDFIYSLQG